MRKLARIALSLFRPSGKRQSSAAGVARIRSVGFATATPVYDLTVDGHGCYFANGFLVSNSDAAGEFAINCGIYPPAETKKPKPIEVRMPTLNEIVKEHGNRRKFMGNRI